MLKLKTKILAFVAFLLSFHSHFALAEMKLQPVDLQGIGKIAQFTLDDKHNLLVINQQGELWQVEQKHCIINGLSTEVTPKSGYGKIALADKNGHFLLWDKQHFYRSNILLARHAGMAMLPFATIAVREQQGQYDLVRIETKLDKNQYLAYISAQSETPVLPDAQPIQVNFSGQNSDGHIAVLARPDAETYQHGVLGDKIEAGELQYLERHHLKPLAKSLSINGLVFENNRLEILPNTQGSQLVGVMAGDGDGAKTVIIDVDKNILQQPILKIVAESQPLPPFRWQSPFIFHQRLYAVQMPHIAGHLVHYQQNSNKLQENHLASGLSNHRIGHYQTNLIAMTDDFLIIPKMGYKQVSVLKSNQQIQDIPTQLPSKITQMLASKNQAYLLLENGQVWQAVNTP